MGLFGVDIAGILNAELGGGLPEAKLVVVTRGVATPGALTSGTNVTTSSYDCRGLVVDYDTRQVDGTLIQRGDRIVQLMARSVAGGTVVPKTGDKITIEGRTYSVVTVDRSPGSAYYDCQVRG